MRGQASVLGAVIGGDVRVDQQIDGHGPVAQVADRCQPSAGVIARGRVPGRTECVVVGQHELRRARQIRLAGGDEIANVFAFIGDRAAADVVRVEALRSDQRAAGHVDRSHKEADARAPLAQRHRQRQATLEVAEADGDRGIGADRDVHAVQAAAAGAVCRRAWRNRASARAQSAGVSMSIALLSSSTVVWAWRCSGNPSSQASARPQ